MSQAGSSAITSGPTAVDANTEAPGRYSDCLACRVIGTGALGATGIYALNMTRASALGSPLGKRVMGGVGVGTYYSEHRSSTKCSEFAAFLIASAFRWTMK